MTKMEKFWADRAFDAELELLHLTNPGLGEAFEINRRNPNKHQALRLTGVPERFLIHEKGEAR